MLFCIYLYVTYCLLSGTCAKHIQAMHIANQAIANW